MDILKILQWNCRSIFSKLSEFKHYLTTLSNLPHIICLQETFLSLKYNPCIPGYHLVRKDRPLSQGKGGGVCMFIKSDIIFSEITGYENNGNSEELMAIKINGMVIVNMYNKPNNTLPITTLNYFTKYSKLLILGDLNAHHRIWGSNNCNSCGTVLADWIINNDYVLLNTTQPTYCSDVNPNRWSLLDLSIASHGLAHKCTTEITSDFLGSDHCILFVNINESVCFTNMHIPRWSFSKANWLAFSEQCDLQLGT